MKKAKIVAAITITLFLATVLSTAFVVPGEATSPGGLVGRWHFDEGIGSTAADSSGNTNDGTLSGGKFSNALEFVASEQDYVEIPHSSVLSLTGAMTVEAWVRASPQTQWQTIVNKQNGQRNYGLFIAPTTHTEIPGGIQFRIIGLSPSLLNVPVDADDNSWHHVAGVYTGSALKIFFDGAEAGSLTVSGTPVTNTDPVTIGGWQRSTTINYYLDGVIDEVRISDVARYTSAFTPPTTPFASDSNSLGLWHFDESTGNTAYDASTNDNDGTIHDASWAGPTWTTGLFGTALRFDGIDDYVRVPDSGSLNIGGTGITLEAWIRADTFPSADRVITIARRHAYALQILPGGKVRAWLGPLSPTDTDTSVLSTGTWHHIAATYDGAKVRIFVDGALKKEVGKTGNQAQYPNDVFIGNNQLGNGPFDGIIDEARIWSRALSAEEIKKHAWGLVGEWDFNEGSDSTAHDSSGHGNDGSICGATWTTEGKSDDALDFDGIFTGSQADGDYVLVSSPSGLHIVDQITVEAWIKPTGLPDRWYGDVVRLGLGYQLCLRGDGKLEIALYRSGGWSWWDSLNPIPIPATEFYHVAFTYDKDGGANNLKIYINGQLDAQYTVTGAISSSGDLWISPWFWPFEGIIDEVRIWNKALIPVKFDQTGLDSSATGTVVTVDDPIDLEYGDLSFVMMVRSGAEVTYTYTHPVPSGESGKRFRLDTVTGGASPSDTITVTGPTPITGNYVTQYYLIVETDPPGVDTPTGEGWYDEGASASISTDEYVDIEPGSSRYRFDGWTTTDMDEIDDPDAYSTTVLMDKPKTVTANYVTQYKVTFDQTGVGIDFTGTVVTIDSVDYGVSDLPMTFWWDENTPHSFTFDSPLPVESDKQYVWTSTTGLSTSQSDTITVTASGSVTGNYKTQYEVTFDQTGLDATASGTVVTINGVPQSYGDLPFPNWYDSGTAISYVYTNPVPTGLGKQFWLSSVTGPESPFTVTGPVTVIGNYLLLPLSEVTTSDLCYFDIDPAEGQQFRLIFTPNPTDPSHSTYRLTASNPGQFYYNVFYVGTPGPMPSLTISIPYPFETKGADPIHVYSSVSIGAEGCFVPSNEVTDDFTISPSGNNGLEITVSCEVPDSGLVYVTVHLDYGLKKTEGYAKDGYGNAIDPATIDPVETLIPNSGSHTFSYAVDSTRMDEQMIENMNVFKHDPGFAGMVTDSSDNPLEGVEVEIIDPDGNLLATVYTDEDGYYFYYYKHTGKEAIYTVILPGYGLQEQVAVKANRFVEVNFQIS